MTRVYFWKDGETVAEIDLEIQGIHIGDVIKGKDRDLIRINCCIKLQR